MSYRNQLEREENLKRNVFLKGIFTTLLFITIFLFTISSALATDFSQDIIGYWSGDDKDISGSTLNDNVGSNDITLTSSPTTGFNDIINEGIYTNGGSSYLKWDSAIGAQGTAWTLSKWFNTSTITNNMILSNDGSSSGFAYIKTATSILLDLGPGQTYTVSTISTNTLHLLTITHDGSGNYRMYLDGVESSSGAQAIIITTGFMAIGNYNGQFAVGIEPQVSGDMGYWSYQFSDAQVTELYNLQTNTLISDSQRQYPFASGITNFEITNNASLNKFSVNITNSTTTTSLYNSTGTIIYEQTDNQIANVTIYNMTYYFNESIEDYNTSTNLEMNLTAFPEIYTYDFETNISIDNFNLTIDSVVYQTTNGTIYLPIRPNETINGLLEASGYLDRLLIGQSLSGDLNFSLKDDTALLTFVDGKTSLPLTSSDVTIHYPDSTELDLVTDVNGKVNFSLADADSGLINGTYVFEFLGKLGYITPINFTENIQFAVLPFNETYEISQANLNIAVYDRETTNLLTGIPINIFIIGIFNETTTTGLLNVNEISLTSNTYTIYAVADNFTTERVTFVYTNQENLSLSIFMQNLSGNVVPHFVSTLDEWSNIQPNTFVEMLEYFPANDSFIKVSECISNSNGECLFYVELGTKLYIFSGSKLINGVFYTDTTDEDGQLINVENDVTKLFLKIFDDFMIPVSDQLVIEEPIVQNTTFNSTHNEVYTGTTFYTLDGTDATVCIAFYEILPTSENLLSVPSCVTSSNAIISITPYYIPKDKTIKLKIYQDLSGTTYTHYSYIFSEEDSFVNQLNTWDYIPPFILLFWILILLVSILAKNITLFGVLSLPLTWVLAFRFASFWTTTLSVLITMFSIFIIILSRRRQDLG